MQVYLNGSILPIEQANLNVQDAGLQHAVGLFETMLAHRGRVFRLEQHLQRLAQSARELGLAMELDLTSLRQAVVDTLAANDLQLARIRLTITAGSVSLLAGAPAAPAMTTLVVATPPTQYDPAYFSKGIRVVIAPPGANPFDALQGHKTLAYWGRLRTLRQAAAAGAGEAIWLNVTNHLASGAVSNVFLVKNGVLYTPFARGEEVQGALPAPVLPGITRAAVIELARQREIEVKKQMLSVEDLLDADEIFLTNSSWLLLPVTSVEKKTIGPAPGSTPGSTPGSETSSGSEGSPGTVGPITSQLRQDLLAMVSRECGEEIA